MIVVFDVFGFVVVALDLCELVVDPPTTTAPPEDPEPEPVPESDEAEADAGTFDVCAAGVD